MPLYRRLPFQRSVKERRSLHWPAGAAATRGGPHSGPATPAQPAANTNKTSIDLELDLAAQQSKLMVLGEEIERLRQIKNRMEEAKAKGEKELPVWLQEDEKFQYLLASVSFFNENPFINFFFSSVGGKNRSKKLRGKTNGKNVAKNSKRNLQAAQNQNYQGSA